MMNHQTKWYYYREFPLTDADRVANAVDSDQTIPKGEQSTLSVCEVLYVFQSSCKHVCVMYTPLHPTFIW